MFQPRGLEETKTYFTFNNIFPAIMPFMEYVEKHGRDRQTKDADVIRRMRFACWIPKVADTHSECAILTAFSTIAS